MVTVTAKIEFFMSRKRYVPGEKFSVTTENAQRLANAGYIKSILKPVVDKMIREPKKEK